MTGKPLKLDWNQLLPEKESAALPLELEVVPTSPALPSSVSTLEPSSLPIEQQMTDGQLEEKMRRLAELIDSGFSKTLPDKGQKLLENQRSVKEELSRRKLARDQKNTEKCETATESKDTEPNVIPSNSLHAIAASECDPESSFSSMFNQKLDQRAGRVPIGKVSTANHKGTKCCGKSSQNASISSRQAPFQPISKVASMREKRFSSVNCNGFGTSSFYAPCAGRRSKRLKLSEGRDTLIRRPNNAKDVVLLDEEDVQPKDSIILASDNRMEAKMCFPSRDHPESVELSYSDLKCLEPEQYISSPIMNFYIRYLQRSLSSVKKTKIEYYFFNTYFFGKLEEALLSKNDGFLRFSKLRRWWKGVNIFEKAYIFLPIHKDLHWSLVIISISPKEHEYCPVLLHLDSLGLHNSPRILELIQCYLTEEWKHVSQSSSSPHTPAADKAFINLPFKIHKKVIKVPQQKNEYDCGLFVLYFVERFIKEAPPRLYSNDPITMFGTKWFRPEDASGLRERIKDLLLEEFESLRLECVIEEDGPESPSSSSEADDSPSVQS